MRVCVGVRVCGLHMIMYLCMCVRVRGFVCATYSDHPIGNFALMLCNQLQVSFRLAQPSLGLAKADELEAAFSQPDASKSSFKADYVSFALKSDKWCLQQEMSLKLWRALKLYTKTWCIYCKSFENKPRLV